MLLEELNLKGLKSSSLVYFEKYKGLLLKYFKIKSNVRALDFELR